MSYQIAKWNFPLSAELFWYFLKDWINEINQYEAGSGIQNITAKGYNQSWAYLVS